MNKLNINIDSIYRPTKRNSVEIKKPGVSYTKSPDNDLKKKQPAIKDKELNEIQIAKIGIQEHNMKKKQVKIDKENEFETFIMEKRAALKDLILHLKNGGNKEKSIAKMKKLIIDYFD